MSRKFAFLTMFIVYLVCFSERGLMGSAQGDCVVVAKQDSVFGATLAKHLKAQAKPHVDFVPVELGRFADTENIIRIPEPSDLEGKVAFLVYQFSFAKRKTINDQLMEFLLLADQLKNHKVKKIIAVLPYMPYARQCLDVDGKHPGPLLAVSRCCQAIGIDQIVACELHEPECESICSIPFTHVTFENVWYHLLKQFLRNDFKNVCFLSPDEGGVERVKKVAQLAGHEDVAYVEKTRVAYDRSVVLDFIGDVKDKIVVLIDDIVDTGRTAVNTAKRAREKGAKKVIACFCHPVLSHQDGLDENFDKIFVCDTILLDTVPLANVVVVSVEKELCAHLESLV